MWTGDAIEEDSVTMSHHGMPTGAHTPPTTGVAKKSKRIRFGPGRVVTVTPPTTGNVTMLKTDATIGKPAGNLRHMKWKPGQPLTPQERRRRERAKAGR